MTLKSGQRSLKVIETGTLDRLCMVSYYCPIATLSVEKLEFKNAVTLKTGLGSIKVIENVTIRYSTWLPINVPQQPWAYLVPFPRETAISVENRKIFPTPSNLHPRWKLELGIGAGGQKN